MAWPNPADYSEAVQNLRVTMEDDELRAGEVARNPLDLPMLWSGGFADVYKIRCPTTGNTWALKCFTREVRGLQDRYRQIAIHLEQAKLPFTVDFQYLERGVRVQSAWFPALKMRWVEGLTLNRFVEEHLQRPRNLKMLLDLWVKLTGRLREAAIAHADLQHGNVLLVPQDRGTLALRLIDYDGMYVPNLAGRPSGELGHPAYQHPQRLREGIYNGDVDRFSHLAIYTSIRCLIANQQESWQQFNNGDNLLFREVDFADPTCSPVFQAFWQSKDREVRALIGRLALACRQPMDEVPWLDRVVDNGRPILLTREEEKEMGAVLFGKQPVVSPPPLPNALQTETLPSIAQGTLPVPLSPIQPDLVNRALRSVFGPVRGIDRLLVKLAGSHRQSLRYLSLVLILSIGLLAAIPVFRLANQPIPGEAPGTISTAANGSLASEAKATPVAESEKVCDGLAADRPPQGLVDGAIAFIGPKGAGRTPGNGFLVKAPRNWEHSGTTWTCDFARGGNSHGIQFIHPCRDGHALVTVTNERLHLSSPGTWPSRRGGYEGLWTGVRLENPLDFKQLFRLEGNILHKVTSTVLADGSFELTIDGKEMAKGKISDCRPLKLTPDFKGQGIPKVVPQGYGGVIIGATDRSPNRAEKVFFTQAAGF